MPGPSIDLLLLKTLLAPTLIGLASAVARRWGPDAGGWCVALPLTSGPVVLLLAAEHGRGFAAQASVGVIAALASLAAFALAYGWSARRLAWGWSSVAGCAAYLASTALLQFVAMPLAPTFLGVCALLAVAVRAMPADEGAQAPASGRTTPVLAWDLPLRMALAAVLVAGLTHAAGVAGPHLSGLLTPFPIAVTIVAAFTHRLAGSAAAVRLLRGLLLGLFSFAVFFLVLGAVLPRWNVGAAFGAATAGALAVHGALWRQLHRAPTSPTTSSVHST